MSGVGGAGGHEFARRERPMPGAEVYADARQVTSFVRELLLPYRVPADDATTVAECLVKADLRGVATHGVTRLPGYLSRLEKGLINPRPRLAPVMVSSSAALVDGDDGFGFVVGTMAMSVAMGLAEQAGVGVVAVRRSTHFGMAASYVLQAVAAGHIALVCTNASPAMPPWGGRQALLGTGPLAAGAPGGPEGDFVFDMSPAVAARGKIRDAARHGAAIPPGYALDAEGRPTTDPHAVLDGGGTVLPVGGAKGSGLAVLVDVLAGALSGAAFAGSVGDQYHDFGRPQNVGHFFMVVRSDLFLPAETFRARVSVLRERVRGNAPAEGWDEALFPGDIEARAQRERERTGIPYARPDIDALNQLARKLGVEPLDVQSHEGGQ